MPKRSSKPRDVNQLARAIVDQVTGETPPPESDEAGVSGKNPAAVALGRLGGAKGGPARAAALSKRKRSEIAKKAAIARWSKLTPEQQAEATRLGAQARFKKSGR